MKARVPVAPGGSRGISGDELCSTDELLREKTWCPVVWRDMGGPNGAVHNTLLVLFVLSQSRLLVDGQLFADPRNRSGERVP